MRSTSSVADLHYSQLLRSACHEDWYSPDLEHRQIKVLPAEEAPWSRTADIDLSVKQGVPFSLPYPNCASRPRNDLKRSLLLSSRRPCGGWLDASAVPLDC